LKTRSLSIFSLRRLNIQFIGRPKGIC